MKRNDEIDIYKRLWNKLSFGTRKINQLKNIFLLSILNTK